MTVRDQTNLVTRDRVYYFRKKVPSDLVAHYGKASIGLSLRQFPDNTDAKREARRLADHYEAEFAVLRGQLTAPLRPLTADLVPKLAAALEAHVLRADDAARVDGLDEAAFAEMAEATADELQACRAAYGGGPNQISLETPSASIHDPSRLGPTSRRLPRVVWIHFSSSSFKVGGRNSSPFCALRNHSFGLSCISPSASVTSAKTAERSSGVFPHQ
ncbi:MAG: DUF6538 domain-containing protein [Methylibium sp.]